RHVTCTFHGQGITEDVIALLNNSCVSKVLLAFRNTKQGVTEAEDASSQLAKAGLSVHPVTFPANRDANDVLVTAGPERLVTLANMAAGREMPVVPSVSEPP